MAREISIREEFLAGCDEQTLQAAVESLSREFLLIPLGEGRIEIHDSDYEAVAATLNALQGELGL